jgi:hypothetical protein
MSIVDVVHRNRSGDDFAGALRFSPVSCRPISNTMNRRRTSCDRRRPRSLVIKDVAPPEPLLIRARAGNCTPSSGSRPNPMGRRSRHDPNQPQPRRWTRCTLGTRRRRRDCASCLPTIQAARSAPWLGLFASGIKPQFPSEMIEGEGGEGPHPCGPREIGVRKDPKLARHIDMS